MQNNLHFFERDFPSANMILLTGANPILVDSGFGSDVTETVQLLREVNTDPGDLQFVLNTHYHSDHVGGNHHFQTRYGCKIAASRIEGEMINRRDPESCSARWLVQPIEHYHVDVLVNDGDVLDTGTTQWQIIHTPGHALGHISLYADGILIAGDTFHDNDVAWLNPFREGATAPYFMMQTLDRLADLPLNISYSGHGQPSTEPSKAIDRARQRIERWLKHPEKMSWHGMKRIFVYHLMLNDGLTRPEIRNYLLNAPWYHDYCRHVFDIAPEDFIEALLNEILRSKAASWHDERLRPTARYTAPPSAWSKSVTQPDQWPPATSNNHDK